jgi:HK97 family phage major capsid protein
MNTRDRLKGVREQIAAKRSQLAAAKNEVSSAREAFDAASGTGSPTDWPEFAAAQEAVRKKGQLEDDINDLKAQEDLLVSLLGDSAVQPEANRDRTTHEAAMAAAGLNMLGHSWDGHGLLAVEASPYLQARESGIFTSQNRFGTVQLGQIASREQAATFFSQPMGAAPGVATSGPVTSTTVALGIDQDRRGMLPTVLRRLSFLDLIPKGTTDSNSIEYVQVQAIPGSAAFVAEGAVKPEQGLALQDATAAVRTIAGWIKVNRQAMDDMAGLGTLINTLLPYDVRRQIENQILTGNGAGQNLRGIYNTSGVGAPAFVTGDNAADAILRAMTTVILSDADPNFVAANPLTWQDILLLREGANRTGAYVAGGPFSVHAPTIWGLTLTANRTIPVDQPLVGDSMGATLLFREGVNVKTSDSDQDDFIRNRVTVLAEARVAFPVWRPASFAIADPTA